MSSNLRSCCQPASSPSKYSLNGLKSCTASSPEINRCMRSDSPSYAAAIEQKHVSPPISGLILEHSIVPIGGSVRNVSSVCQISVAAGGLPSLLSYTMSSGASLALVENGCTVSSPKYRPNRLRSSDEIVWFGSTSTPKSA